MALLLQIFSSFFHGRNDRSLHCACGAALELKMPELQHLGPPLELPLGSATETEYVVSRVVTDGAAAGSL